MSLKSRIPNILTILRFPLSILAVFLLFKGSSKVWYISGGAVFILCCLTDFLDGYLARKWQTTSSFGKTFDPMADKVLIIGSLIALMVQNKIIKILGVSLISRDIIMDFLRLLLYKRSKIIPASRMAKAKTVFQMVGILIIILASSESGSDGWFSSSGNNLYLQIPLIISAVLSWLSFLNYIRRLNKTDRR